MAQRTLQQVRKHHNIALEALTAASGLPCTTVYLADIGTAISQADAAHIVETLAQLTGQPYTLDTIEIQTSTAARPSYAGTAPHVVLPRQYEPWHAERERDTVKQEADAKQKREGRGQ